MKGDRNGAIQAHSSSWLQRPRGVLFLAISYLLWLSVSLRWITEFIEQDHPQTGLISAALLLFGLLLGAEPWLTRRVRWRAQLYLLFQTALIFLASLLFFELDFFALLYVPLCGQAMFLLPRRLAWRWLAILIAVTVVGQLIQFGWPEALSFIALYAGALIFVTAFSATTLQADKARRRSEHLLRELQEANRQLQRYADQAEKLAVANERNRLARDLHDSVAQTLYGLTLQSEAAARKLHGGQVDAVQRDLAEMRDSAQQTLQETRLLIFELRPPILADAGLAGALQNRLEAVEGRSGLVVESDIRFAGRLPDKTETALYRIAQEALNNVVKHARATTVAVSLQANETILRLIITDDGLGFSPAAERLTGGLGLQGMGERAEQIGASLQIDSTLEQGTSVSVELSL
ncbi:MAG: sensor histidine kinase [Candidatus Promineifilaceae bacterium]|nr:sensor histidine kinase [Candidatus Promineifilaceae bacterium]